MNGRPLGVQFKRNSAYVAQEDCFVPTMSAWETLKFTATLTLPKAISPAEAGQRISEVLKIMGLWRSRDTQVPSCIAFRNARSVKSSDGPHVGLGFA
jgi:ABC-type multidrug transport system ATPase subunit